MKSPLPCNKCIACSVNLGIHLICLLCWTMAGIMIPRISYTSSALIALRIGSLVLTEGLELASSVRSFPSCPLKLLSPLRHSLDSIESLQTQYSFSFSSPSLAWFPSWAPFRWFPENPNLSTELIEAAESFFCLKFKQLKAAILFIFPSIWYVA